MKKEYKLLSLVLLLILLFTFSPVDKAEAAVKKSVTVTTQKQLNDALTNTGVSKITIKPSRDTSFMIPYGDYHKELIIYQTKANIINSGTFDSLNIIVANENELSKALNTYDIDTITVKTSSKSNMVLNGGNSNINLVVDAFRLTVANNSQWNSITVKKNASWIENAVGNNFVLTLSKFNLTTNENAAVESIYINRNSATLNINANSTIAAIKAKYNATINLSGKFEGQVLNSISKQNAKGKVKAVTATTTYSVEAYNTPNQVKTNVSKAHVHDDGAWIEQTATTTRIGAKVRYCMGCRGVLEIITSPMLSEDPVVTTVPEHTHEYVVTSDIPATCKTIGIKTYTCIANDSEYVETTPAACDNEGIWYEQKATTTNNGLRVRACTKCGAIFETVILPKLEEEAHEVVTEQGNPGADAVPEIPEAVTEEENSGEVTEPENTEAVKEDGNTDTVNGHKLVTVTIDLGNGKTKEVKGYYDYAMAQEVYNKLNDLRKSKGLNPLTWNNGMAPSADVRAAELTVKFDHWRPNGEYCYYIYDAMVSENVAMGYTSATDVMVGWINSPSHYNAMVKTNYKSVSISCFMYEGLPGQYLGYWSMLFSY